MEDEKVIINLRVEKEFKDRVVNAVNVLNDKHQFNFFDITKFCLMAINKELEIVERGDG